MTTNDLKLLEKVLSKWEKLDKEYSVIDTSDCSNLGDEDENSECDESLCNKHRQMYRDAVATMIISEARADQLRIDTYNRVQSLKQARADERSNMMELLDEVVIDLPEKNDETYENGINDLAVAFKVAMKEKYPYEDMRKKVQTDTAKQIFKELDEAVWEQIEPSRLEEFLEQFSNAKDLKASLNVATAFSIIGLDAEKYEALKKQYNLEA